MRRSFWTKPATLALTLAVPFALACGGGEDGGEMSGEMGGEEPAASESGGQESMSSSAMPQSASLMPMGDSQVGGTVEFTREGDALEVHVMAENMPGPGDYASHIHNGSCGQPGGVVTPLNDVSSAEGGAGEATTSVDATQLEAGSPYLVMVHGSEGAPVACADVPSPVTEM